jgi:chromosome partitioning protein
MGVTLAPASTWLVGIERALAGEVGAETLLRRAVSELDPGAWDYLLIDCPPTLGLLTINALTAAEELLVPIEAHVMALHGLAQLLQTVDVVQQRLNATLVISGMLACRVDHRTRHAQDVVEELRGRFGNVVYNVVIRENVRLAECPSFAQPITVYAPTSAGAHDYRALAQEVMQQESALGVKQRTGTRSTWLSITSTFPFSTWSNYGKASTSHHWEQSARCGRTGSATAGGLRTASEGVQGASDDPLAGRPH